MIRRDTIIDAAPAWIIIPQVEHARLSGQLAEALDTSRFPLLGDARLRGDLLDAIYRHDDGWARWDPFLQLDPDTGAPRQFTEMLSEDAATIWLHSIRAVGETNPLGGHIVTGHFAALLARHIADSPAADPQRSRNERFAEQLERLAVEYLRRWQDEFRPNDAESPPDDERATWPARCLALLQVFDYLSLWLCCRERPEPFERDIDGRRVRFTATGEGRVTADPWPFAEVDLTLRAGGLVIPVGRYGSNAALAAARSRSVELTWIFSAEGH